MQPTFRTLPTRRRDAVMFNRGMIAESGIIPAGTQVIRDVRSFNPLGAPKYVMSEDISGKQIKVMKVTGLFQEADKENANGRVYPYNILASATKAIQEDIGVRSVYAEYDHPADAKIHLDRVSHLITKLWMDGPRVYGEAEILDNQPFGACLRGLFERKCRVGISSRGVGDMEVMESNGKQTYVVSEGYLYVTFDAVGEPSVHGANLSVMESLNKKTKPIREARSKNLLEQQSYEALLVEAVNEFFDLKPLNETKKPTRKKYFF